MTFDLTGAPRFPMVRVSVAVATVLVASPHLTRPTRVLGQALVALLALTSLYLSPRGFPTDLIAAIVLGWGVAHAVEYAFGTPVGRPSIRQVEAALAQFGVDAQRVSLAKEQPIGRAVFVAERADDRVRVVALGRDEADAQLLSRAWRYLAYRDAPPTLVPTRRAQVEYEAYLTLLARDAGVDTPRVVVAGTSGALALLVVEQVPGTELYDLDADTVSDQLLDTVWGEVRSLHAARVAHGKLDARHVLIDGRRGAHRRLRLRVEQRTVPPDRRRRGPAPGRDRGDRRPRACGRRRGARRGQGDGRRRAARAAGAGALGLDPRRVRRTRPARRPPRRAAARSAPRPPAPTRPSSGASSGCSPAAS